MITLEKTKIYGWEEAIRGMRNPMNSWEKGDSWYGCAKRSPERPHLSGKNCPDDCDACEWCIGPNDHELMMKLAAGGPVHAKYRRMIAVYVDITAPLYWWKEFDTYKVGTVANSCSTMHKIHAKEFEMGDFSCEHLADCELVGLDGYPDGLTPMSLMRLTVDMLNYYRKCYNEDGKTKDDWYNLIQLLPSSYNQKRTIQLNYEVLVGIYQHRKNHKLDEWHVFCDWIEKLPYSEIIIGKEVTKE
jgi:hypothetical protein